MADTSTADDIAASLRTRAEELREQLAGYKELREELDRLEAALEILDPDGPTASQGG
jgi:hypothetical protein